MSTRWGELYSRPETGVLVAVASRYGATREIAQAIAAQLRRHQLAVDLFDVEEVSSLGDYDAVVLGSAVYMGKLLPEARSFINQFRDELNCRQVWFFSSGPIGAAELSEAQEAIDVKSLATDVHLQGHKIFAGKLDKSQLSFGQRLVSTIVRAKEGDFRNWPEIEAWARAIGHHLCNEVARATPAQ